MRMRIRIADLFEMEYQGPPAVWNDVLRTHFGGPPVEVDRPAPSAPEPQADPPPSPPDLDADSLFEHLAGIGGRRSEKDAVLVAVWEHDGVRRDVGFDEVARSVHGRGAFRDVRVKPHLLKHVNRSRMLDTGSRRETVRLTSKGRRYVESLAR
jgi:hypothetical protein